MLHIIILLVCVLAFILVQCLISVSNDKYRESLLHLYKVTVTYKIHYSDSEVKEYTKELEARNTCKEDVDVVIRADDGVNRLSVRWSYYNTLDKSEIKIIETTAPIELVSFSIEEKIKNNLCTTQLILED